MLMGHKRVGISGGTFDPVHYGHLIIAQEIREKFGLDKIIFIPSGLPPHKDILNVSCAEDRFNMVCSAVESNPFFDVSRIEVEREGYTYTIDTLLQLKAMYGEDTQLFFITGADVIQELLTWRDYKRVFTMCEFVSVLRPGHKENDFLIEIDHLKREYSAIIHTIDAPLIGISSTEIRERVLKGRTIKYLVPENVEKYIYDNGLYK